MDFVEVKNVPYRKLCEKKNKHEVNPSKKTFVCLYVENAKFF